MPQPPYPLHPSVAHKLSPQYVSFYNRYLINLQQAHYMPIGAARIGNGPLPGPTPNRPVGKVEDFSIRRTQTSGPDVKVRCFSPEGDPPADDKGWPAFIYYHGGGWVFGDISSESTVCTNLCSRSRCVVITTDYRLAPEEPYPAAVEDCWEALLWTFTKGASILNLDTSKVAIGGASAGANLAAAVTQKALFPHYKRCTAHNNHLRAVEGIKLKLQLLVVPVLDNTATPANNPTYKAYEHTAALPAMKMLWYRNHYLPDPNTWSESDASPLLFSIEHFAQLPPAVVLVAELDVVRHEGEEYARKLRQSGVETRLEVMKGMPHPFLAMDAVLDEGKRAITILCESLVKAFA